jgi:phytanoyl-CoA hydroxylase
MSQFKYFGHLGDVQDPLNFFLKENYLICRGATNIQQIDELVEFYNQSIVVSDKLYLRQSSEWECNQKSSVDGITNCFLQPHSFEKGLPAHFSDKILRTLSFRGIQEALSEISGKPEDFKLVQTMFFDHSTTNPHQDWIYLDSRPNGHLIAAWVALEDIHLEGIRFYVYPGTQNFSPKSSYNKADKRSSEAFCSEFIAEINTLLDSNDYVIYAPPLKKGDIFFWGSRIIHGSTPGTNPDLRRRSIAAHFLPSGFGFGNLDMDIHRKSKEKYGLSYSYFDLDLRFQIFNSPMYRVYDSLRKEVLKV